MSKLNQALENRLSQVRQDARYRPMIDAVKAERPAGLTSDQLLDTAVRATVDEFKRSGRPLKADAVREAALLAATAAAVEAPVELADLPAGTDKTQHFLASAYLSLKATVAFDKVLPRRWAESLGTAASVTLGWVKELYDAAFATGYNREDLKADVAGAKRPYQLSVETR